MTTIPAVLAQMPWWWQPMTTQASLARLAVMLVGAILLVFFVVVLRRLALAAKAAPVPVGVRGLARDERATATVEFALVFPIVLFIALLVTQTTLLMGGNLFVHYAAFAATRSAIVQVPSINSQEDVNQIIDSPGFLKHNAIRASAVFALLPVAGRIGTGGPDAKALIDGLNAHFDAYGKPQPVWIAGMMAKRLAYADANTTVKVLYTTIDHTPNPPVVSFSEVDSPYTFGPRDPITVLVTHNLNLSVPYVNLIFADAAYASDTGTGRNTKVEAQYTLTNEGVLDELPPLPKLPRTP